MSSLTLSIACCKTSGELADRCRYNGGSFSEAFVLSGYQVPFVPTKDPHDGDFTHDIDINDVRNRYLLTKGATQQQVRLTSFILFDIPSRTGADVDVLAE